MKLPISRLNHLIVFGAAEAVDTDTIDGSTTKFVAKQQLHCALYQRSQTQNYSLLGTKLEGTIVVAVRSQYHVDDTMQAQLDGNSDVIYQVVDISCDESHSFQRYDLITLEDITKGGN